MKPVNLHSKDDHFCVLIASYMNILLCPSLNHTQRCSQEPKWLKQFRVQCYISRLYQTKMTTTRRHYINTGPGDWGLKDLRTRYMSTQSFQGLSWTLNTTIGNLFQYYSSNLTLLSIRHCYAHLSVIIHSRQCYFILSFLDPYCSLLQTRHS